MPILPIFCVYANPIVMFRDQVILSFEKKCQYFYWAGVCSGYKLCMDGLLLRFLYVHSRNCPSKWD